MAGQVVAILCLYLIGLSAAINKLNEVLFGGDYEFIDLTHPFHEGTVYFPNNKDFEFTKKIESFTKNGTWYAANEFSAAEHGGTHIDSPYHFAFNGLKVGDIPLDKLIVPLIIVDVASQVNDNADFVLYKQNLDYLLNDNMGKPCLIVFKFGWSKYFDDKAKYLGANDKGDLKFPGLSAEIGEWITTSYKNVVGIGVDVASVDPGSSKDFPVHHMTARAGLYNVENVKLDRHIPEYGCTALVLPMKIAKGTGAPLRLVAVCPKQIPERF